MKNISLILILILLFNCCHNSKNEHRPTKDIKLKSQRLDSLFSKLYGQDKFNGNILISENGQITFEISYGFANAIEKTPLKENHIFDIASITKQFTATAIVMLKENNELSFDDKITKYIPQLTEYKSISIKNLLNHTSGLGNLDKVTDSLFKKEFNGSKDIINSDLLSILTKYKPTLKSDVLEKFEYSNTGYQLLAIIIEKISGLSYAKFIRENILKPLKMKNTFIYGEKMYTNTIIAEGHYFDDSLKTVKLANSMLDYERFKIIDGLIGGKGIYSTTNDLLIWTNSFKKNKLISKDGFNEMITRAILKNNSKTEYGFGFELGYWKDYSSYNGHRGRWPGYTSLIQHNPKNDKTVIILQNFDNRPPILEINNILHNIKPLIFIKLSKPETFKFTGEYKNSNGSIRKIVTENEKIYVQMNPVVKLELKPISSNKFVVIGFRPEVQYEFIEENGKVIKYISRQPEMGILIEGNKI